MRFQYAPNPFEFRVCMMDAKPHRVEDFVRTNPDFEFGFCCICGDDAMTVTEHMPEYAVKALTRERPETRMDLRAKRLENMYRAATGDDS